MFALGVFAWSALASGLGPILMLRVWRLPVSALVGDRGASQDDRAK